MVNRGKKNSVSPDMNYSKELQQNENTGQTYLKRHLN